MSLGYQVDFLRWKRVLKYRYPLHLVFISVLCPHMLDEHMEEGMSVQPKLYELGYLLAPLVASESLDGEVAKIKEITGEAKAEGGPKMQHLAYTISKKISSNRHDFDDAYFGWIKFEATPEQIKEIKKELEKLEMVIRFLLTTTELTDYDLNPIKEEAEEESDQTKEEEKEEKKEVKEEDARIDKEIDDLLERGEL
jgi:ribosomal protein S6